MFSFCLLLGLVIVNTIAIGADIVAWSLIGWKEHYRIITTITAIVINSIDCY